MKTIRMEDMTWPEIKAALEEGYTTVVTAVGSTEQHGPHLPTKTDTLIGDALAHRVALKLGRALQAKTISTGCSDHHLAFPGTISLRSDTLKMIMRDYTASLKKHGFKTIVYLPSHGGNFASVEEEVQAQRKIHPDIKILAYTDLLKFVEVLEGASGEFGVSREEAGAHAGENETSIILALEGDLVKKDRFSSGYLGPLGEKELKVILEQGMPVLTQNGVLGDPSTAAADRGEAYLEKASVFLADWIKKQL
ncbi:MAG: creatininase family protein [Candidatus Aminicenantes bacterium]|nr:creatininase family protein [Candidatus Aminicenantes bacterium]